MRRIRSFPLLAAIALALTLTSCGDRATPLEPTSPPNASLLGDLTGTLTGTTETLLGTTTNLLKGVLACPSSETYTATRTIGSDGGVIYVGPHRLFIPPGALDHTETITATAPAGPVTTVSFEPHGLYFKRPTALTMSYAHCGLISGLTKRVVYVDDDLTILEVLPSLNSFWRREVTGKLDHFSSYAVAE